MTCMGKLKDKKCIDINESLIPMFKYLGDWEKCLQTWRWRRGRRCVGVWRRRSRWNLSGWWRRGRRCVGIWRRWWRGISTRWRGSWLRKKSIDFGESKVYDLFPFLVYFGSTYTKRFSVYCNYYLLHIVCNSSCISLSQSASFCNLHVERGSYNTFLCHGSHLKNTSIKKI